MIIQTAFIGDVVLATALIEKLRIDHPEAEVDFLVRKGNEGLLGGHPHLSEVLVWDKKKGKYREWFRLARKIRQKKYDHVYNLQRFAATGALTWLSGAAYKVGFDKNPFSFSYHHKVAHTIGDGEHEVERNLRLVEEVTAPGFVRPRLYPSGTDRESVRPFQQEPYICIAPTSVWFTKQFPPERWAELLQSLDRQYAVYLLGGPEDREACDAILRQAGRPHSLNLAGELSLLGSAALMEKAVMNYVNDSAPLHFASAMNAPTIAVFCSTVPRFGFGPLADRSKVVEIREDLHCRPCGLHGYRACPEGHFQCAGNIRMTDLLLWDDREDQLSPHQ